MAPCILNHRHVIEAARAAPGAKDLAAKQKMEMRVIIMSMATIRISEAEAIRNIAGLLARAYKGEEIIIEKDAASAAVMLRTVVERPVRRLSESLRLTKERGSTVTLDGGFGLDLEAVVNSHPESLENPWG